MTPAKHRLSLVGLAALLLTTSWPVVAADGAGNYAIWGSGGRSCHQFRRSAGDAAARESFRNYLMGYLTAYNTVAEDTYNALGDMNLETALDWLTDYCAANQMDSYDRAVTSLVIERHPERIRAPGGRANSSWGRAPVAPPDAPPATPAMTPK